MGRVTVQVCAFCLAVSSINEYGEVASTCSHYELHEVEAEVVLTPETMLTLDQLRWKEWVELWDECEEKRAKGPAPYLHPDLDWTPAGRQQRRLHRQNAGPMTLAGFNKALKSVYNNNALHQSMQRQAYGNSFTIPLKTRWVDEVDPPPPPTDPAEFTRHIESRAPIIEAGDGDPDLLS